MQGTGGFGPWGEKQGPRPWTPEEALDYEYEPCCSVCCHGPGEGKLQFGEMVTDVESGSMIRGMVEEQPEMVETVLEASRRGGTVLFLCHEKCAGLAPVPPVV